MRYQEHISQFVSKLRREFGQDYFEWIEAPEGNNVDLEHIEPENIDDKSFFEINVAIHIEYYSEEEVDEMHDNIHKFAKEQSVQVDLTETNNTLSVYKFSLHSNFLNVKR